MPEEWELSDMVYNIDPEIYEGWHDLMKYYGELMNSEKASEENYYKDRYADPMAMRYMAELCDELGLEEQYEFFINMHVELIERWEEHTGLIYEWEYERWRDPDTGRWVKTPYKDERWLKDPETRAKFGLE
jgi:hypothetical protein